MPKIIKQGKNIILNPVEEYVMTCKVCETIFTFEKNDCHRDMRHLSDLCWIHCPNCNTFLPIWKWKRYNEKYIKK